jgi:hypothetical protein
VTVIALAGRRIDASDAPHARFPLANRDLVRERLRDAFARLNADTLVCSAACGADLLALEVAGERGMERHVVLPFGARHFRRTSVADRPGNWGPLFDRVHRDVRTAGHVVTLRGYGWGHAAYEAATLRILATARTVARGSDHPQGGESGPDVQAIVVWDGEARGPDDLTARFMAEARASSVPVIEVPTL